MTEHKAPEGHLCEGCLKYEQFGPECHVYWEMKKHCTQKVQNVDDLQMEKLQK